MDFAAMAELCAPNIGLETLSSLVSVESSFNPYAIGVVGGRLQRQPRNLDEAIATADMLDASGYNYSLGLAQINQSNFKTYGLTRQTAFDPCKNLAAGASILADCYGRAGNNGRQLGKALSCYNSGNFKTGFRTGYVAKVIGVRPAADPNRAIPLAAPSQPTSKRRRVDRPISETEALLTSSPTPTTQPADPAASTAFVF